MTATLLTLNTTEMGRVIGLWVIRPIHSVSSGPRSHLSDPVPILLRTEFTYVQFVHVQITSRENNSIFNRPIVMTANIWSLQRGKLSRIIPTKTIQKVQTIQSRDCGILEV